eukprot:2452359-Karenia_brevis.AAC.1
MRKGPVHAAATQPQLRGAAPLQGAQHGTAPFNSAEHGCARDGCAPKPLGPAADTLTHAYIP